MKQFLQDICRGAGRITLDYRKRLSSLNVEKKSPKDVVTEADKVVERFIVDSIRKRYPDHGLLGEESGVHEGRVGYRWIIDPIDGTNSFLHKQPFYAVSIALEKNGTIIMGAVNAPILDEFFFAERGRGATLNDKPVKVSTCDQLINGMMGTGFACVRNNHVRHNLPYFSAILPNIRGIRRFGSVAIDLSYVACGRLDGFWELGLHLYDIAAGALILEEAGGTFTDFRGQKDNIPNEIVGTNGLLHTPLLAMLQEVDRRAEGGKIGG